MDLEDSSKSRYVDADEEGSSTPQTIISRSFDNGDVCSQEQHKFDSSVAIDCAGRIGEEGSLTEAVKIPKSVTEAERNGIEIVSEGKESVLSSDLSSLTAISAGITTSASTKGQGLRKWRRRRRHVSKNGTGSAESTQILKRRFSTSEPPKVHEESKLKNKLEEVEVSITSPESQNARICPYPADRAFLNQELELLASKGFSVGIESDNSEDRSSKSSTAASAPRLKHELLGFRREKGKTKSLSGGGSAHAVQSQGQYLGVDAVDSCKKYRDKFKFDKENSYSSVESDLRSSPVGVVQQGSAASSNGKQGGRSLNFDCEYGDEPHAVAGSRSDYCTENRELENPSGEDLDDQLLNEDTQNSVNYIPPSDYDPSVESIAFLQEAQEALEDEIHKIGAIGRREAGLEDTDSLLDGTEASSCPTLDLHLSELNRTVEHLESMLGEATETIKAKQQKVAELEAFIARKARLPEEEDRTDQLFLREHRDDAESELEAIVRKAMEAEIEYLILTRTSQCWKVLAEDQLALFFKEQRSLSGCQEKMMQNLREVEQTASRLKDQSSRLGTCSEELSRTEEVLKLQNKVFKLSLCYLVQFLLLCVAFCLFLLKLFPPASGVVPT